MTDEQFDRDLQATLDKLMAEPAPATLRARVERTLADPEAGREARPRRRLAWLGAAIAAAVVVATPVAFGVLSNRPSVGVNQPTGTPSVSAMPSESSNAAPPSASPSGPSADQIGLPLVKLSADVARRTRVDTMQTGTRPGGALVGPYLDQLAQNDTAIQVLDVGGGSIRLLNPSPVGRNEVIAESGHDSGWIVLVVTPSDLFGCQSHPTTPMPWRIEVAPLGPDAMPTAAFRQVASGTEQSKFAWRDMGSAPSDCAYALPPLFDLSGDLLAWSSSSSAALDAGSDVTVVSLATSAKVASYRTATRVVDLGLSQQALAWVESTNLLVTSTPRAWKVMEARLAGGEPSPVDIGVTSSQSPAVPEILVDGTAVAADYADPQGNARIVRVEAGRIETVSPASGQVSCGRLVAADAGRMVVGCDIPWVTTGGAEGSAAFLAVWTSADGLHVVQLGGEIPSMPPEIMNAGGWIAWFAMDVAAAEQNPSTILGDWIAIPIDALAAPAP